MPQDLEALVGHWEQALEAKGVVACLFALAHAVRGANDRAMLAPRVPQDRHLGYVREYVANQLSGLAAFWRVHLPESSGR